MAMEYKITVEERLQQSYMWGEVEEDPRQERTKVNVVTTDEMRTDAL